MGAAQDLIVRSLMLLGPDLHGEEVLKPSDEGCTRSKATSSTHYLKRLNWGVNTRNPDITKDLIEGLALPDTTEGILSSKNTVKIIKH